MRNEAEAAILCYQHGIGDVRTEDSNQALLKKVEPVMRPEAIAQEILASEDFMWLMVAGDDVCIDALRPAWDAYVEAGGKTYGHHMDISREEDKDGTIQST